MNGQPINVALHGHGGLAIASSTYDGRYSVAAVNNGDRKGLKWGNGGVWHDATGDSCPDWMQ